MANIPIDPTLRSLFRSAAAEYPDKNPPKIVITEYVALAHAFLLMKEPIFVNAVLDHMAKELVLTNLANVYFRAGRNCR